VPPAHPTAVRFHDQPSHHLPGLLDRTAGLRATLLILWKRTGQGHFRRLARFWTKIFAVSFAMGVVSGITLSYEFGTNWACFSEVAGNVIGPLMGYEVLTEFSLEATFLGVMLFGWQRVAPWLHVTAAILVALGTHLGLLDSRRQ
jgi:cytochrome d ubiquinol oxidase subunit I